jgi:hypothetical protein
MRIHQKVITGNHVAWFLDNYESLAAGVEECMAFWPEAKVSVQRLNPNDWPEVESEDCIIVEIVK